MTIKELQAALAALVAKDAYLADASVTYGQDFEPVEGGIIAKHNVSKLVVLNLAPLTLDKMGGF